MSSRPVTRPNWAAFSVTSGNAYCRRDPEVIRADQSTLLPKRTGRGGRRGCSARAAPGSTSTRRASAWWRCCAGAAGGAGAWSRTRGAPSGRRLARSVAAIRVWVLLAGGQVAEAGRAWRLDGLPERADECTELATQSWREAELIACARLRLCFACGWIGAARGLAAALQALAAERGLVRTARAGAPSRLSAAVPRDGLRAAAGRGSPQRSGLAVPIDLVPSAVQGGRRTIVDPRNNRLTCRLTREDCSL